jgi:hypothetical protein
MLVCAGNGVENELQNVDPCLSVINNLNCYVQLSMYLYIMLPSCLTHSYFHKYDVLALFLWEEFDLPDSLAHALPLYDIQPNPGLIRAASTL